MIMCYLDIILSFRGGLDQHQVPQERHGSDFFLLWASTLVNMPQGATNTANTTHQGRKPMNKPQGGTHTAHRTRWARPPVTKRQEAKDTAHTAHQGHTRGKKRPEATDTHTQNIGGAHG